jgi:hypothetical protein
MYSVEQNAVKPLLCSTKYIYVLLFTNNFRFPLMQDPYFIRQLSFVTVYRYYVARVGGRCSGLR